MKNFFGLRESHLVEKTMELAGETFQNMEHCPGAVAAFKRNLKDGASKEDVIKAARAVDAYLAVEDKAKKSGATAADVKKMKDLIANAKSIISAAGLEGHTYHDMHLDRVQDMVNEAMQSADKKPQNYVDQDTGKTKTRMVPVDKEVVKEVNVDEISLKDLTKTIANSSGLKQVAKAGNVDKTKKDLAALKARLATNEKTLTPAEKKKREEIAKAMERENPGMDMSKKMAIATAAAKRVAEANVNESIAKMSHARLKFHATKGVPHGSYSNAEIKDEHKRRMRVEPDYVKAKASMNESYEEYEPASPDEKSMAMRQAKFIMYVGEELMEHLEQDNDFPEWMQNKLSAFHQKAQDMHATMAGEYEDDEDEEDDMYEAAPKIKPDFIKTQRERDRAHDAAMGRTATGRKKPTRAMTSTQRSMASMRKEEAEQIDEISKKTLGSYIKKASSDMANNAYKLGARDPLKTPGSWDKAFKRKTGITKATDRLAKEELELDEKAYVSSTSPELGRKGSHDVMNKDGKVVKSYPYTKQGMAMAQKHLSKLKEEAKPDAVDVMRRKQQMAAISSSDKDKLSKIRSMLDKQKKPVNEISDKMKDRYVNKAMGDHQHANAVRKDAESRGDTDLAAKMRDRMKKRNKGMTRAFGGERD